MKTISFYKEVDENAIKPYELKHTSKLFKDSLKLLLIIMCEYDNGYLITVEGCEECVIDKIFDSKKKAKSCLIKILKQEHINIRYLTNLGFNINSESKIL